MDLDIGDWLARSVDHGQLRYAGLVAGEPEGSGRGQYGHRVGPLLHFGSRALKLESRIFPEVMGYNLNIGTVSNEQGSYRLSQLDPRSRDEFLISD
jgi:hypothetical protein